MWTSAEIEAYRPRESPVLSMLYAQRGLFRDNPKGRASFLADYLQPPPTDHDIIMRTAHKQGRSAALNLLEDMTVAHF